MKYSLPLGLLVVASLAGCKEKVDSTDIRTHGVYADFDAVANESGTTVSARLLVGGSASNTYLELQGQDHLIATVGTDEDELTGNNAVYRATFSEGAGDTPIKIDFVRGSVDEDAPNSNVTLPEPFTLNGIGNNQEFSRADEIIITWEPATDDMDWDLEGDCIDSKTDSLAEDQGTLTIPAGDVTPAFPADASKSCRVTLTVNRSRAGQVDANFGEGGSFIAIQRRTLSFISTP